MDKAASNSFRKADFQFEFSQNQNSVQFFETDYQFLGSVLSTSHSEGRTELVPLVWLLICLYILTTTNFPGFSYELLKSKHHLLQYSGFFVGVFKDVKKDFIYRDNNYQPAFYDQSVVRFRLVRLDALCLAPLALATKNRTQEVRIETFRIESRANTYYPFSPTEEQKTFQNMRSAKRKFALRTRAVRRRQIGVLSDHRPPLLPLFFHIKETRVKFKLVYILFLEITFRESFQ